MITTSFQRSSNVETYYRAQRSWRFCCFETLSDSKLARQIHFVQIKFTQSVIKVCIDLTKKVYIRFTCYSLHQVHPRFTCPIKVYTCSHGTFLHVNHDFQFVPGLHKVFNSRYKPRVNLFLDCPNTPNLEMAISQQPIMRLRRAKEQA